MRGSNRTRLRCAVVGRQGKGCRRTSSKKKAPLQGEAGGWPSYGLLEDEGGAMWQQVDDDNDDGLPQPLWDEEDGGWTSRVEEDEPFVSLFQMRVRLIKL